MHIPFRFRMLLLFSAYSVALCLLFSGCNRQNHRYHQAESVQMIQDSRTRAAALQTYRLLLADGQNRKQAVRDFVAAMPLEEKIAQLFLINIEGNTTYVPVEYMATGQPLMPGGCIFFSYNVADTPESVHRFTSSIVETAVRNGLIPPLISIDQEGGVVNRLSGVTSPLPSAALVAERMIPAAAEDLYRLQGIQMAALGFQINLAPVAEPAGEANRDFLGTRSYGGLAEVCEYGAAAIRGYENQGIGTVLKHFPGNTNEDPHTGLPEITLSAEQLEQQYLTSFRKLLEFCPAGVLMSHARTSAYDSQTPACLSHFWVTEQLRERYGYSGLIFSDDIFMAALEQNGFPPETAVIMAVKAGIDCIMLSEKRFGNTVAVLMEASENDAALARQIDESVCRIITAKIRAGILELIPVPPAEAAEEPDKTGSYSRTGRISDAAGTEPDAGGGTSPGLFRQYIIQAAPVQPFDADAFYAAREQGMELYNQWFGKGR